MISVHHILWYNPVSLKKDRTSFLLTFLNKSLKLFTLHSCFLMRVKALNSMRTYLTVQGVWHVKHWGCYSCFSIKEWVSLLWPIMIVFFLIFWKLVTILPNWAWSGRVCCGYYYSSVAAILCEGICWFWISSQYMESWIHQDSRLTWLPSLLFHFVSLQCGLGSSKFFTIWHWV